MLSEILIAVGAVLIVAGFLGLKMKTVGKRLIFLCIAGAGMILLSVAEMNTYGLVGGSFQAVYRIVAVIPCLMLFHSICKKNEIKDLNGLDGIGTHMPYTYAILVLLAVMCIGVPVTGTFTGIIYSEIGLLAGSQQQPSPECSVSQIQHPLSTKVPNLMLFLEKDQTARPFRLSYMQDMQALPIELSQQYRSSHFSYPYPFYQGRTRSLHQASETKISTTHHNCLPSYPPPN